VAASKASKPRNAEENWHCAKARVLLWRLPDSKHSGGAR
jgi:hypothetical protein